MPAKPPVKGDVLGDFKAMDGQCVLFAMIGVVFYIAYCFRGASILYYFTYNLQRPDLIPMIGIFGTLSGLPALLAAPYVLKHITRRLAMFLSVLTYALGTLLLGALNTMGDMVGPLGMLLAGMAIAESPLKQLFCTKRYYLPVALRLIGYPVAVLAVLRLLNAAAWVPDSRSILMTVYLAAITPACATLTSMAQLYHRNAAQSSALYVLSTLLSIVTMPVMIGLFALAFPA